VLRPPPSGNVVAVLLPQAEGVDDAGRVQAEAGLDGLELLLLRRHGRRDARLLCLPPLPRVQPRPDPLLHLWRSNQRWSSAGANARRHGFAASKSAVSLVACQAH